jgi:hypothetical protein
MKNTYRKYFSKYTDSVAERFELFWALSDVAAKKEAKSRVINDGLELVEVNRCVCITPRVKEVEEIKHRMKLKGREK